MIQYGKITDLVLKYVLVLIEFIIYLVLIIMNTFYLHVQKMRYRDLLKCILKI